MTSAKNETNAENEMISFRCKLQVRDVCISNWRACSSDNKQNMKFNEKL